MFRSKRWLSSNIIGPNGGNSDDLIEAIDRASKEMITPAVMVTHVDGIGSFAEVEII